MMDNKPRNIIPSGIEPVDKLLGGLENGHLYLVHGEAAGKSLFGIQFLIEGLKRGENGALVIRYSPEDAVRRFARLGYDCLEDVYSGRLVILEYSDDIIQQISRLKELTPVLRELEWLLGETRPHRLIFDPVASLILSEAGDAKSRAKEFTNWAGSFDATVVLVANGDNAEIVESLKPIVSEVFRFELKESVDRATRFLAFEKSLTLADQPIEVDPSRGIFLLGRAHLKDESPLSTLEVSAVKSAPLDEKSDSISEQDDSAPRAELDEAINEGPLTEYDLSELLEPLADLLLPEQADETGLKSETIEEPLASKSSSEKQFAQDKPAPQPLSEKSLHTTPLESRLPGVETGNAQQASGTIEYVSRAGAEELFPPGATQTEDMSELIEELAGMASPLDLEIPELEMLESQQAAIEERAASGPPASEASIETGAPVATAHAEESKQKEPIAGSGQTSATGETAEPRRRTRAADHLIDSAITARAVELLLRPPETIAEPLISKPFSQPIAQRTVAQGEAVKPSTADPKHFSVLIIDDDPASCEMVAQTLSDYHVEAVHDGVSGLAKLISFKPDLVVLDVDLPIVDGFKMLAHIRSSLNMPIIVVSGTRVRASDRVMSAELGADYFLTKPFSVKELQQKARQLIARYRGINSWIITSPAQSGERFRDERRGAPQPLIARVVEPVIMSIESGGDQFTPYDEFAAEVERRVRAAIDDETPFSIVGCRLPEMTASGGRAALRLFEMVSALARDTDLISTNSRNDLVILLVDADSLGARAFINRLRERALAEMNVEPSVWLRSFPELEEAKNAKAGSEKATNGNRRSRRASDEAGDVRRVEFGISPEADLTRSSAPVSDGPTNRPIDEKPDPRESYVDFLKQF